jgi:UDP-N-acetylmuramoyl-tripeptide--D-alanyl-D-alanine ligase
MIENQASFSYSDLYVEFGPESLSNFSTNTACKGISIDTRTIRKGNAFVALVGGKSDGHKRVAQSFEHGATFAIVNKSWFDENKSICEKYPLIIVEDTSLALGFLGALHRSRFEIPIIAVAGSNGKTSTKEMAALVLSEKYKVLKTYKNFNNQLGVPLMLLALNEDYGVAVLEIGTNSPGEIEYLCKIVRPTHGIITNIGKEHLEKLIDLDGVEMEETALFTFLLKQSGMAFINSDDTRLSKYKKILKKRITFGTGEEDINLRAKIKYDENLFPSLEIDMEGKCFSAKINSPGYTSAINALAASAIGFGLDLNAGEIKSGLEKFKPSSDDNYGRMLTIKVNNYTILNDCYNANPTSVENALDTLSSFKSDGKKIAVLGDMLELGENSASEHLLIIKKALLSSEEIFLFGDEFKSALNIYEQENNSDKIKHFSSRENISESLKSIVATSDIILVKGSRGMKLESIVLGLS